MGTVQLWHTGDDARLGKDAADVYEGLAGYNQGDSHNAGYGSIYVMQNGTHVVKIDKLHRRLRSNSIVSFRCQASRPPN